MIPVPVNIEATGAWRWRSFERILHHVCKSKGVCRVLEWGPGHSTSMVRRWVPKASILTIEHNPKFAADAKERFDGDKAVELVERVISMKGGVSNGYVSFPLWRSMSSHHKVVPEYDIVFVDGRFRFDCIMAAYHLVKNDGVVIVHDAHRVNYTPAIQAYPHHRILPELRTAIMSKSPMPWLDNFHPRQPIPNDFIDAKTTIAELSRRFKSGKPFTHLRFGDADLLFINDPTFDKNRRHDANPAMSKELADSFAVAHPNYMIGCAAHGVFGENYEKEKKLAEISLRFHEGYPFWSAVALQVLYTNDAAGFAKFVKEAFWGKRVLLVGGVSVCRNPVVKKVFNIGATIEFTDRNAYLMLDSMMPDIVKSVPKFDVVISALGQATRVLGGRLWKKGIRTQYFDVGSVIDALAGRPLRSWIRKRADRLPEIRKLFP